MTNKFLAWLIIVAGFTAVVTAISSFAALKFITPFDGIPGRFIMGLFAAWVGWDLWIKKD